MLMSAPDPHAREAAPLRQGVALGRRWLTRMGRAPEAMMDVIAQPILFLVMFTFLFGGAIAGSTTRYAQFLVPGVLTQTVVIATVSLGVSMNADVRGGFFDRLRSLPIARSVPLVAAAAADAIRYVVAVVVTLGAGFALGWRPERGLAAALAACCLVVGFGFCLSWLPLLVGLAARSPSAVQGALLPLMFPLTFVSSAFVPTAAVPGWLRVVVRINPVSQATSAARGLLSGGPVGAHVLVTLAWMALLLATLVPCSIAALRRLD